MFGASVALFATANWVHIPFEEAKMRRQFGAVYDNYVARVAALDMTCGGSFKSGGSFVSPCTA